ncbi:MAG: DDE-type integrase/transposase/recombinase [Bacteriovorax sp.]
MFDDEKPSTFRYSEAFKKKHVQEFVESKLPVSQYMKGKPFATVTFLRWVRTYHKEPRPHINPKYFSLETRMKLVDEYLKSNMPKATFGKIWGISSTTLVRWIRAYEAYGAKGLEIGKVNESRNKFESPSRGRKKVSEKIAEVVIEKKKSFPEFGLKKLHNSLMRFQAVKIAPGTIKRILKDENIYNPPQPQKTKRKPAQIRRFERANPMQLWQSDITSYLIGRENARAYLVVFMDDHSRYIVSWSLAYKQTGEFVMNTLYDGISKFGKPHEVLTDQGRQYFSWRGRSEFQRMLIRQGIQHVVARSHHPQTLGKCERFWKTVGVEFWDRARPKSLDEAKEKFAHFVNHYNHFRPHQGLNGMIPADRFFGVESEVKKAIEKTLSENELRLAVEENPKKPVFLFGQIGDQKVSLHGERGKLVFQSQHGHSQEINYDEFGHEQSKRDGTNSEYETKYNSNHISEEEEREEDHSDHAEDCDIDSFIMDDGEYGGEDQSEGDSSFDYGLLDGETDEGPDSEDTWNTDGEDLADEPDGPFGYVCSDVDSTEGEESDGEQGRRSENFEEEDYGVGEDYRDSVSFNRTSSNDAGMHSSRRDSDEETRGTREAFERERRIREIFSKENIEQEDRDEEWEEETARTSESPWDYFWRKKD